MISETVKKQFPGFDTTIGEYETVNMEAKCVICKGPYGFHFYAHAGPDPSGTMFCTKEQKDSKTYPILPVGPYDDFLTASELASSSPPSGGVKDSPTRRTAGTSHLGMEATMVNQWAMAEVALKHLRVIAICGLPGVGKTYLAQGGESNEAVSINFNEDTCSQEMLGHYVPEGNQFVFHDGPAVTAFRQGRILVLNELSRASGAVKDALLGVLDSKGSARLTLASGETITVHPKFRAIITSNEPADELDPALRDRCEAVINVNDPHPGLIAALNFELALLGDAVADSYKDPKRAISTRASFAFAKMILAKVTPEIAASLAYGERANDILATFKLKGIKL